MSETEALFGVLRQSADADCVGAIEHAVADAPDHELCRINVLAFAAKHGLEEERAIAAFLHAARLGLFELSFNVLCPGCGGVLDVSKTLKTVNREEYACGLCAGAYKPTLDEMVEVTFTVSPRVRRIAGHDPQSLPEVEYLRQIFFSSGVDLPEDLAASLAEFTIEFDRTAARRESGAVGATAEPISSSCSIRSRTAPQFIDVKGEPTRERQALSMVFNKVKAPVGTVETAAGAAAAVAGKPHRLPRVAGTVDRRRRAASLPRQSPAVPDRKAAPDQPDLPRHLRHRHAGSRPAAQDHQPDFSVHRPQGLDRAL